MQNSSQKKSPSLRLYWLLTTGFFVVYFLIILSQLEWPVFTSIINRITLVVSSFDLFFLELLLLLLLGGWLLQKRAFLFRLIAYALVFLYALIALLQTASFYQSGKFVTKLAAENINHLVIILNTKNTVLLSLFFLLFIVFVFLIEKKKVELFCQKRSSFKAFLIMIFLSVLIILSNAFSWWSEIQLIERNSFLVNNQLRHHSPMLSMYKIVFSKSMAGTKKNREENIAVAEQYGFNYKKQRKYPLLKDSIYQGAPPFSDKGIQQQAPNVIAFFIEGFSARTSNVYGSEYDEITPNLVDFSKQAMVVDNYYNHTAATYRGLHGQLCSIYPKHAGYGGGWADNYENLSKVDYFCLMQIFNNYNYQSIFLHSQLKESTFLDEMMNTLGFDQVWTADSLLDKHLKNQKPLREYALSDQQYFSALIDLLKEKEQESSSNEPFFMSVYNFETHAFLDVIEDGKRYGDGSNISLNTIHNLDDAFGQFWKYYKQSALANNTIIIFTSDHSHYHEKPYVEAFDKQGSGYQKLFVDQIPLIIHDPTRILPARYDAKYASSIDLAPSLIHYLGLANHQSAFMGRSIFEARDKPTGVASIGGDTFVINEDKIYGGGEEYSGEYQSDVENLRGFIAHTQWLEMQNRVWDTKLDRVIKQKANTHFFDRKSIHIN